MSENNNVKAETVAQETGAVKKVIHQEDVRVAIVNPPYADEKLVFFSIPYLVNGLRQMNPDVEFRVFDCPARKMSLEALYEELKEFKPDIVGVSIPFTLSINAAIEILHRSKELFPLAWTVVGGVHPTLQPRDLVEHADYTVVGDGEVPLTTIIQDFQTSTQEEISAGKKPVRVPSTAYLEEEKMVTVPAKDERMYMGDPDWGGLDLTPFLYPMEYGSGKKGFSIFTSKGCPFVCTYCSNHLLWGRKIVYRDLDRVFAEIKDMMETYKIDHFVLEDDLFTVDKRRVYQFCDEIEKRGLKFEWMFQTRANLVTDRAMFARMRQVGAKIANMGIETGNERVLKANKSMDIKVIFEACKMLKELGYLIYAGFIIGFPEDDIESVWDTITFPDRLDIDSPGFQLMIPYPKTRVRDVALVQGGILTNDYSKYSTFNVVYVPPMLQEYDLAEIRKFAFAYFHTRNEKRLENFLKRYIGKPEYETVKAKYTSIFNEKEKYNFDYLKSLRLKTAVAEVTDTYERLPV